MKFLEWKMKNEAIISYPTSSEKKREKKGLNVLLKWTSKKSRSCLTTQQQKYRICLYNKTIIPFALVVYERGIIVKYSLIARIVHIVYIYVLILTRQRETKGFDKLFNFPSLNELRVSAPHSTLEKSRVI